MSLLSNGPHTCDTYTRTETTDASGGQVVTYTARDTGVVCLVRGATSSEKMMFIQQQINVSHVIASTWDDFREGDKVVTSGDVMRVVGIRRQQGIGGIPGWYEIYLEEMQ